MIVFTIGSTKSYQEAFRHNLVVNKIGKSEDYEGGWIWKTKEDAYSFLNSPEFLQINWGDGQTRHPANFSIYKVLINDWNTDVYKSEDNQFHLLVDGQLMEEYQ